MSVSKSVINEYIIRINKISLKRKQSKFFLKDWVARKELDRIEKDLKYFEVDNVIVTNHLLEDFVKFYTSTYDVIKIDFLETCILENGSYSLTITNKDKKFYLFVNDMIHLIIYDNNIVTHEIVMSGMLYKSGDQEEVVKQFSEVVLILMSMYIQEYIDYIWEKRHD